MAIRAELRQRHVAEATITSKDRAACMAVEMVHFVAAQKDECEGHIKAIGREAFAMDDDVEGADRDVELAFDAIVDARLLAYIPSCKSYRITHVGQLVYALTKGSIRAWQAAEAMSLIDWDERYDERLADEAEVQKAVVKGKKLTGANIMEVLLGKVAGHA